MIYEHTQQITIVIEGKDEIKEFTDFITEAFNESRKPGFKTKLTKERKEFIAKLYSTTIEDEEV